MLALQKMSITCKKNDVNKMTSCGVNHTFVFFGFDTLDKYPIISDGRGVNKAQIVLTKKTATRTDGVTTKLLIVRYLQKVV